MIILSRLRGFARCGSLERTLRLRAPVRVARTSGTADAKPEREGREPEREAGAGGAP
jgi:hypothetical protein